TSTTIAYSTPASGTWPTRPSSSSIRLDDPGRSGDLRRLGAVPVQGRQQHGLQRRPGGGHRSAPRGSAEEDAPPEGSCTTNFGSSPIHFGAPTDSLRNRDSLIRPSSQRHHERWNMRLGNRFGGTASRRRGSLRKGWPSLEILEPRQLLSTGFVQGFALNNSSKPVSGATVQLLTTSNTLVAQTTTNSSGYYAFNNLTPGTYNVMEFASGYTTSVSGSDIHTTVNPASAINSGTEIQVTVLDLSTQSFGVTWTGVYADELLNIQLNASSYNQAGAPQNTGSGYNGQLQISLNANQGNVKSTYTFCSDLLHGVLANSPFTVQPSLTSNTTTLNNNTIG